MTPTKETNDVTIQSDPYDLLQRVNDHFRKRTREYLPELVAEIDVALEAHRPVHRATWGDVLAGDRLAVNGGPAACDVISVADQDETYLAIRLDCGAGEHTIVVPREEPVR